MIKCVLWMALSLVTVSSFADANYNNYWSGNVSMGVGWSSFSANDTVDFGSGIQSQYATSSSSSSLPIMGLGLAYNAPYPGVTLGLGVSAYYMHDINAAGVKTVVGTSDTLQYSSQGQSYALMLEPKFTWTQYAIQPYVFVGAGVALNDFGNYSETPTDPNGGASAGTPFNTEDEFSLAYEMGIGVQYVLSQKANAPIVALDYRFMNWGNAGVAATTGQVNGEGLNFGNLRTSSVNLSLIVPF
ncbi:MAG: hypothetical protein NTV32_04725 [Gammaproteobacteria bacterium]|nr:hypothetical protein [Gammaproteobacteria bacterium]